MKDYRAKFTKPIESIRLAAARQATAAIDDGEKPLNAKDLASTHQHNYEKGLARELSLIDGIVNPKEPQSKMLAVKVTKIQ